MVGTLTMLVMGYLLEMGRDAYSWVSERWRFRECFLPSSTPVYGLLVEGSHTGR